MADQYLLPCSCGKNVVVEPRLAGGDAACECGKLVRVPTLREMRTLTKANPDKPVEKHAKVWSPWQGALLTVGVLLLVASLVRMGYVAYVYTKVPVLESEEKFVETFTENIENATPLTALVIWDRMVYEGLSNDMLPPDFKQYNLAREAMIRDLKRWAVVAGIGLLTAVASLFFGGKP